MRISDWSSDVCSSDLLGQEIERLGTHRRLIVEKGMIIVAGLDHRVADHIAHEAADLALRGGRIAGEEAFAENLVARSAPIGEVEIIADRKSTRLNSSH